MDKHVTICVTSDLSTDQRIQKVTSSLHNNGFEVLLVGRELKNSLPFHAPYPFKRFKLLFSKGFLFYATFNLRLFFFLLFKKTDIILANDTDTLLSAFLISKIRNKTLVFDAHELFPELPEVTNRKTVKKVWTGIENFIFPKIKNAYTVSNSIAVYYHEKYGLEMKLIRNVPYLRNFDKTGHNLMPDGEKTLLYQGAVNMGRGLEWVIECMPLLENCKLLIIGGGDILDELKDKVQHLKLEEKVHFTGKILPEQLFRYTAQADIGLCLLENDSLSYYYALPNRVFDYMHAGVPILATNFPEIASIVKKYNTGVLIDHYEPEYLAGVIGKMLADGKTGYTARLNELGKEFCWENEEKKLLGIFSVLK